MFPPHFHFFGGDYPNLPGKVKLRPFRLPEFSGPHKYERVHRGEVATPEQAHAYIWMILQPYASLDGLCMTLLSPEDKKALDRIATETPGAFETLRKILPSERNRLDELPGMLMEIFIASL